MPNYANFFVDGKNTLSESLFLLLRGMLPQIISFDAAGNAGKNDDTEKKNRGAGTSTKAGNASAAAFSHTYTFAWAWVGSLRPTLTGLPPTLTLTFIGQGLNIIKALALRIHE